MAQQADDSRTDKGKGAMDSTVQERVQQVGVLEQKIANFRGDDSPVDHAGIGTNAMEKLYQKVQEIAGCYQEAFSIYCQLNRKEEAITLLDSLFDQIDTCYWNSSSLAISFLLSIKGNLDCLERWIPGTKEKLKHSLHSSVYHKLSQHSITDLPLVMEALKLMSSQLAGADEQERRVQNARLCHVIELTAHTDLVSCTVAEHLTDKQGKLNSAIGWYDEGKQVAQSINIEWAQRFADSSSHYRNLLYQMPPEPLFAEPLGKAVAKATAEQHTESFLPTIAELHAEYESLENKLECLLSDGRLLLDDSKISLWAAKYPNSPLKEILSLRNQSGQSGFGTADSKANPLGVITLEDEFRIQYLTEIEHSAASLFGAWRESGELTAEKVLSLLQQGMPNYDWRLFNIGAVEYFQQNYVLASHILVSQFEGATVSWARSRGCVKKIRHGEQGEYYLSDLVKDDHFRELLGEHLCDLIFWYMVNREATQFNHRNKLAHGFVTVDECNWEYLSAMTIWLALKVATSNLA